MQQVCSQLSVVCLAQRSESKGLNTPALWLTECCVLHSAKAVPISRTLNIETEVITVER